MQAFCRHGGAVASFSAPPALFQSSLHQARTRLPHAPSLGEKLAYQQPKLFETRPNMGGLPAALRPLLPHPRFASKQLASSSNAPASRAVSRRENPALSAAEALWNKAEYECLAGSVAASFSAPRPCAKAACSKLERAVSRRESCAISSWSSLKQRFTVLRFTPAKAAI